jgi:AcrR family transcriptional regulator
MSRAAGKTNNRFATRPKATAAIGKSKPKANAPRARSPASLKDSAPPRGDARRKTILQALHACVLERGYSKTTLADIAQAAGMYPSHLLYYFNGKEAILEQYFLDVAEKILVRLKSFTGEEPRRQIDMLANLFFAGEGIRKSEFGFMLECFGVAVNDHVLREEKSELDRTCKNLLIQLFEKTPARTMKSPKDCAEVAYAMLIGLRSAVYFDEQLSLPEAYRLFHSSVRSLAGLDEARRPG